MRIGELAQRTGVEVDTIRYYEKSGLLPSPPRQGNGYREYGEQHIERLAFIRHCRALDMSLTDIRQLIELMANPLSDGAHVDALVQAQLARVQNRLQSLQAIHATAGEDQPPPFGGKTLGAGLAKTRGSAGNTNSFLHNSLLGRLLGKQVSR